MIIFWVEAHKKIGFGHLMETMTVADELRHRGHSPHFVITRDSDAERLVTSRGFSFSATALTDAAPRLVDASTVVVDHRSIELRHLLALRESGRRVAVIDQLGNKPIVADLLINAAIVPRWREYDFPQEPPKLLFGPDYMALRPNLPHIHRTRSPRKLLITMGGVDRSGATLRIIDALAAPLFNNFTKEIVVGAGFPHHEALQARRARLDDSFTFAHAVNDLPQRMAEAALTLCAGGNTLYELACLATPAMVLWEDPHEREQGEAFAAHGAAEVAGQGATLRLEALRQHVADLLSSPERLVALSSAGRRLVDGHGTQRICDEIEKLER